jgi:Polyketide synthase modules and related proteins
MKPAIAIVGLACRYPDAQTPLDLWHNVVAQRRAFRRIPKERLNLDDYYHPDRSVPDRTYSSQGAFINNYMFDRVRFHITGGAYRSSDLAHWLALDIATQALQDAGLSLEEGNLPTATTGVLVGNTLTGEFSRANMLRLRWPYVYRVVEAALLDEGWQPERCHTFLRNLEATYKAPFAPIGEESLAGGLSNTIAGRICNYFDFHGGGYTLDGACSSSLLAVYQACTALSVHDIDMALAGGVDLSLDPFELIGFAKTAALAADEMRVFDRSSAGFLPGEGCGFVVLMRYEDAIAQQRHIYAVIRGWGMSSDGHGGITRPEVEGQQMALARAYKRAGFGIDTVAYFEGHGTGTQVGDTTELRALSQAIAQAQQEQGIQMPELAIIGSIKANIGHTKAASGIASLIKATMALSQQILPPNTGVKQPHQELARADAQLGVLQQGQLWPVNRPLRAGVSSMGFGGINTHIVLEGVENKRRTVLTQQERVLLHSVQDCELFLLAADHVDELGQQIEHLLTLVPRLSLAEMGDLAAQLARTLRHGAIKAALVASTPQQLVQQLQQLAARLALPQPSCWDPKVGVLLAITEKVGRIGFLFPGQGAPSHRDGGALRRRFLSLDELYQQVQLPQTGDDKSTDIAQRAIVTASLAASQLLATLGIQAHVAVGHSLGEVSALHWAGAFDASTLLRLVATRGRIMAQEGQPAGSMASLAAAQEQVEPLLAGTHVVIAGLNSPGQTTIAGNTLEIGKVMARARAQSIKAARIPVSHAFHSPFMAAAVPVFRSYLQQEAFAPLHSAVLSTVTGRAIVPEQDLKALLCDQITQPVLFMHAVTAAQSMVDLWIEVGPGTVLGNLVSGYSAAPVISMDAGSSSLRGCLLAIGAAFTMGAPIQIETLFARRFLRPFTLDWQPNFFASPCEQVPQTRSVLPITSQEEPQEEVEFAISPLTMNSTTNLIRTLVARKAELPPTEVFDDSRLLSDLHLNSITVGQIITEACRALELAPSSAATDYANTTVLAIAQSLDHLKKTGLAQLELENDHDPAGIAHWVRPFTIALHELALPKLDHSAQSAVARMGSWHVWGLPENTAFVQELQARLATCAGDGVVLCLNHQAYEEPDVAGLLRLARHAFANKESLHLVVVQHEEGCAGFVRTLHLEAPQHHMTIVTLPATQPAAIEWLLQEVVSPAGYREIIYDVDGRRYCPRLEFMPLPATNMALPLDSTDVLLVTGGGKGIVAECAISLAYDTGLRLILVGRSDPDHDADVTANLQRMNALGIAYRYLRADVTDSQMLIPALQEIQQQFGAITGVFHGAGTNTPRLLTELDEAATQRTLAPKVQGLKDILQSLENNPLRVLLTFGSVIARTGMRGEADYALANDSMGALTARYQELHPDCRCLCIEWSVWSGVGMGERLGRIDALKSAGIMPIAPDDGIALLKQLLAQTQIPTRVIVGGRFGEQPTLQRQQGMPPFLRFLELPKIFYPGIEFIAEADLSLATDPYLREHQVRGEYIVPAVMGLEAMAQAVRAVTARDDLPQFATAQFTRPLVVPEQGSNRIRILALVMQDGTIEVAIRSAETAFQVDHFSARCSFIDPAASDAGVDRSLLASEPLARLAQLRYEPDLTVSIDPRQDLYQRILFHQGRFQRLERYYSLHAFSCIAEISTYRKQDWFARYLPSQLVLGDPAARDAEIHAIQACLPQGTLLPVHIEQLCITALPSDRETARYVYARERSRNGNLFIYDVEVLDAQNNRIEQWRGLHLRQIQVEAPTPDWSEVLLGPYIERKMVEWVPDAQLQLIAYKHDRYDRRTQSEVATALLLGRRTPMHYRNDGKPLLLDQPDSTLSLSHCGNITLALRAHALVGVDLEFVEEREYATWKDLLGADRLALASFITQEQGEPLQCAATRVWGAMECMKKASGILDVPLTFQTQSSEGWLVFRSGFYLIASYRTFLSSEQRSAILTIACPSTAAEYRYYQQALQEEGKSYKSY